MPTKGDSSIQENIDCFQFRITLVNSQPPIWRQILVPNCSLDKLHEYIQTAMGWTNSHLHQFQIRHMIYGDPTLLDDGFGDARFLNSLKVKLSEVFGGRRPPRKFTYEYDFGDGWLHEIEFEGLKRPPARPKPPCCIEGARNCPPEDVGGVWGYETFLEAINDPEHEDHEIYTEWCGGFDAEEFDTTAATKAMRAGLPSWR